MKLLMIANPTAGRGKRHKVQSACDALAQEGHMVELYWTQCRGDATQRARQATQEERDIVIAAGGDGTINEVACGLVGTCVPMGIIPLGTANCLALEAGISFNPVKAAHQLLESEVREIHLGQTGDKYFLLWTGIGLDATAVHRVNLRVKKVLNKLEYVLKGALSLCLYKPQRLLLTLDGSERLEGYNAIIGNVRYYAGRFVLLPQADLCSEELDVCLFKGKTRRAMLRYGWGILRERHLEYSDVIYRKAREIQVESDQPVHVQVDGDYFGQTPVIIRGVPKALSLMIPARAKQ